MEVSIGNPSWTDVVSAIAASVAALATLVLASAAIVGGFVAYRQFKAYEATERIRITFNQVRAYVEGFSGYPSPLVAFTQLDGIPEDPTLAGITSPGQELQQYVQRVGVLYTILKNYLDESDDLLRRNLIDSDFFMSRQGKVIKETLELLRRFADVMSLRHDEALLNRIEGIALGYEQHHGLA